MPRRRNGHEHLRRRGGNRVRLWTWPRHEGRKHPRTKPMSGGRVRHPRPEPSHRDQESNGLANTEHQRETGAEPRGPEPLPGKERPKTVRELALERGGSEPPPKKETGGAKERIQATTPPAGPAEKGPAKKKQGETARPKAEKSQGHWLTRRAWAKGNLGGKAMAATHKMRDVGTSS